MGGRAAAQGQGAGDGLAVAVNGQGQAIANLFALQRLAYVGHCFNGFVANLDQQILGLQTRFGRACAGQSTP